MAIDMRFGSKKTRKLLSLYWFHTNATTSRSMYAQNVDTCYMVQSMEIEQKQH